jgi:hypothetical protein
MSVNREPATGEVALRLAAVSVSTTLLGPSAMSYVRRPLRIADI